MKTFKETAEEAIECLLILNKQYPFKIKVKNIWSLRVSDAQYTLL